MTDKPQFRVLVIDDEKEIIDGFRLGFRNKWDVQGITDPEELKRDMANMFRRFLGVDLIFLDLLFNASSRVTVENVVQKIESGELLGIKFLDWLQENYTFPVAVLSGYLFDAVGEKIHGRYPYVMLKSKPVDLYSEAFRLEMEEYSRTFYKNKYEKIYFGPVREANRKVQELLGKKK